MIPWRTMRLLPNRIRWRIVAALSLLALWDGFAWLVGNPRLFPRIDYVLLHSLPSIALFAGCGEDNLWGALTTILVHSSYTLTRIFVGLNLGGIAGILVGMGIHFFRRSRAANQIILTMVRAVPLFALIPLFLQWFGGREIGIYLYISFGVFVVIGTNTYEAICNVPPAYTSQARLLGANRFQLFRTIYAYAIQPEMAGSLRNVVGLCWAFSLGAEYLSASSGIGYLVYQSYLYSDMGKLIVFGCLYGIYGVATYALTRRLLQNLRKWHISPAQEGSL